MEASAAADETAPDPIITLVDAAIAADIVDDFVVQLASLSDVVKADMREVMGWSDHDIDERLTQLIGVSLDENDRYRFLPESTSGRGGRQFSAKYVRAQCLLTEWMSIYRTLCLYIAIRQRPMSAAEDGREVIFVG